MLMVNKDTNRKENFCTASNISLAFSDLKDKKGKFRENQDQTEVFGRFI